MRFFSPAAAAAAWTRHEIAGGDQLVHRADHVFGIDNQHGRAVLHERAGADVLDLAELRVERLHDQLALAQEAIHDEAVGLMRVADDDDRQLVAGWRRLDRPQHLMRGDEADAPSVELEMLAAFEQVDLVPRQLDDAR